MTRGDVTKLPKWAQREIERLTRDLEHWKAQASTGPEGSDTFANPYSDAPTPLGRGISILFNHDTASLRSGFKVRLAEDGALDIQGGDSLQVQPMSGNTIRLRTGKAL